MYSTENDRSDLTLTLTTSAEQQAKATTLQNTLLASAVAVRNLALEDTVAGAQKQEAEANKKKQAYLDALKSLQSSSTAEKEKTILQKLIEINRLMNAEFVEAVGLLSQFNTEQAAKIVTGKIDPLLIKANT